MELPSHCGGSDSTKQVWVGKATAEWRCNTAAQTFTHCHWQTRQILIADTRSRVLWIYLSVCLSWSISSTDYAVELYVYVCYVYFSCPV